MKRKIKLYCLSDFHLNNLLYSRLYTELEETFLKKLKKNIKNIDGIMILGDFFDEKISVDSQAAYIAIKIITEMVEILDGKPLRILKGTKTHDFNQNNIFRFLEKKNLKVINVVEEEELFPDYNVLYMPEEYPENWKEYYANFLDIDNKNESFMYDTIFMHGMVDFAAHISLVLESEKFIKSAVVFPSKVLLDTAPVTVAGHIHQAYKYKKRIFYCGSFSRFAYGEEGPKGYGILDYNLDTSEFNFERVKNIYAPNYDTIKLSEIYEEKKSIDENILEIEEYIEGRNLRLKIDLSPNEKLQSDLSVIREYFSSNKNFKLDRTNLFNLKDEEDNKNEDEEKFDYVKDKSLNLEDIICKFIAVQQPNVKLTKEEILNIITKTIV